MSVTWIPLLEVLLLVHTGFYLWALVYGYLDWRRSPWLDDVVLTPQAAAPSDRMLDIVIPARNEGSKIGRCLESLEHQSFPGFRVWLVNDRSTDNTREVMAQYAKEDDRFRVLEGMDPPAGWVGKVNAIMQAVPHLEAPWLLFLDADTCLHPENLERALAMAKQHDLEMLSLVPHLECKTFWEQVIQPVVVFLIGLRYPTGRVNNPKSPVAIANGQYILIRRETYERLGTHEVVKASVVEDLDFSAHAKRQGVRYWLAYGASYFSVRMYTSYAEIREGWTKNMYLGVPDKQWIATLGRVLGTWLLGVLPFLTLLAGLMSEGSSVLIPLSWAAWAVMTFAMMVNRILYKINPLGAIFYPVAMVLIGWYLLMSRQMALSKTGVVWKGRYYRASM
jgi:chlorobactene glucosyltransferase